MPPGAGWKSGVHGGNFVSRGLAQPPRRRSKCPDTQFAPRPVLEISPWPSPAPTGSFREHLRSDLAPCALVVWAPAQHPRASSPRSSPGARSAAAVSRGGSGRLPSNPRPGRSALVLPGGGPMTTVPSPPGSRELRPKSDVRMFAGASCRGRRRSPNVRFWPARPHLQPAPGSIGPLTPSPASSGASSQAICWGCGHRQPARLVSI